MTPEQIKLVRSSWEQVRQVEQTAERFYDRLFDIYPELKPLFRGDMKEQGAKLVKMITMAVSSLDNLENLRPIISHSGNRHAALGVTREDYDKVAEALLSTLAYFHRDEFSEELLSAWIAAYTEIASIMKSSSTRTATD